MNLPTFKTAKAATSAKGAAFFSNDINSKELNVWILYLSPTTP